MKKARSKGILTLLILALCVAGGVLMSIYGVDTEKVGKAENIPLGLDLQGGVSVTYEITTPNPTQAEIEATMDKLQRRVDEYTSEGEVYQQGDNRINVEIPVDTSKVDAHDILDQLGEPGQLMFLDETNYEIWSQGGTDYETVLTGQDIKNAEAGSDDSASVSGGKYLVHLAFTDEGAEKFATATANNIGKTIYIIYDGEVVSYPQVQSAITEGNAEINKIADFDTADNLASTIKIGALPLELSQLQYNIVGAKLGQEAVSSTIKAAAVGLGLIFVIMIIIFLLPGLLASVALSIYILLMLLCLSVFDVVLTLPGLAGIVLSIGMAVDANVIIFTRIKEEIAAGSNVKSAVNAGFSKALSAILDGNITTLIAAFVLMIMGTGSIKGFANTLIIGIVLSMFTALVITKLLLNAFVNIGCTNVKLYGIAKQPKKVGYVKNSKICFTISIIAILAGLIFLPINKAKDGNVLNYSLEFTGGTSTTVTFDEEYTLSRAEAEVLPVIVESTGVSQSDVQIQTVEGTNQVIFKTSELTEDEADLLGVALNDKFNISEISTDSISSTISGEMRRDAVLAIAIASILMLIYIAIRFSDVKFGISAVMALIHDVMIVFAVYAIARLSVGNTFIACMLTIVGYSINATIIIFDRIRENMKSMGSSDVEEIVNISISQTFTRSIYTSLTTFVMVLCLFVMGVSSLKEFTLTLMVGIVCGAYSSVCITGPLWFTLRKIAIKKVAKHQK